MNPPSLGLHGDKLPFPNRLVDKAFQMSLFGIVLDAKVQDLPVYTPHPEEEAGRFLI